MATKTGPIGKGKQQARLFEFLRTSKLVNLDQSVAQLIGSIGSVADDIDGHMICWQAYVIIHRPGLGDVQGQREIGG
jgi:hypothetical protein